MNTGFMIRIELPTLLFNCVIPSDTDDLKAGRIIQMEAKRAAEALENELFNRFSDEYRHQVLIRKHEETNNYV